MNRQEPGRDRRVGPVPETRLPARAVSASEGRAERIAGNLLAVSALFLPFANVKDNRVVQGVPFGLFGIPVSFGGPRDGFPVGLFPAGTVLTILFLAVLATAIAAGFSRRRHAAALSGAAGAALSVLPWTLAAGLGAAAFAGGPETGRVSPSAGFWLMLGASYILMHAYRRTAGSAEASDRYRGRLFQIVVRLIPFAAPAVLLFSGALDRISFIQELVSRRDRFVEELARHLLLSVRAVTGAVLLGVPTALLVHRVRRLSGAVFFFIDTVQTIPSLALFGLMIAPLAWLARTVPVFAALGLRGIGEAPALIALGLYALLPVVRTTWTSLAVVETAYVHAGTGMGMNRFQVLTRIEIPLALPVIAGGIRVSTVQTIGNTAIAAMIGAGGLGVFVFQGLGQGAPDLVLLGVFPVVLLAVAADRGMRAAERLAFPLSRRAALAGGGAR